MNSTSRVAGFVLGLAAVFSLALGAGRAFGPIPGAVNAAHDAGDRSDTGQPVSTDADDVPGGLMVSQNDYTLNLADSDASAGARVPVSFTIDGPDGRPVTSYDVAHEKQLHLIAVRRDFTGFQHVHPELSGDGVWSAALDLTPGPWRLFADFKPAGADALTLGADLAVAGDFRPATHEGETRTVQVDGYTVTLDGDLTAGAQATLRLSVTREGQPVTDLQPYLGAYGHLVALRSGDLAYLHVHPDGAPGDGATNPGPEVVFHAAVPSDGRYHLYLDFKHQGVVRTAAFAVSTAAHGGAASPTAPEGAGGGHGAH